jgi:hypothetical protein
LYIILSNGSVGLIYANLTMASFSSQLVSKHGRILVEELSHCKPLSAPNLGLTRENAETGSVEHRRIEANQPKIRSRPSSTVKPVAGPRQKSRPQRGPRSVSVYTISISNAYRDGGVYADGESVSCSELSSFRILSSVLLRPLSTSSL